jgi:threonine/homoserine/homoserine lactone efflux protein
MLLARGMREDAPVVQPSLVLSRVPAAVHRSARFGIPADLTLGLFFDASGTCVNIAVALAASKAGAFLPARMRYVTGGVFIALGLRLAIPERV